MIAGPNVDCMSFSCPVACVRGLLSSSGAYKVCDVRNSSGMLGYICALFLVCAACHCSNMGMQADDWILYSMTHRCELARVRCGGWRRQYACHITSPTTFTFVYYRDRKIHVQRRRQPPAKLNGAGKTAASSTLPFFALHEIRSE